MFLFAHQLYPHRPAHCLRQEHGVGADVVGAVASVAAGGFHADHLDVPGLALQQPGQVVAQVVRVLRAGPDASALRIDLGEGAGRADGGMQLVGPDIGGRQRPGDAREVLLETGRVVQRAWLLRMPAKRVLEPVGFQRRQALPVLPAHLELARGADRLLLAFADHADEVADHDHLDQPRQPGDRAFVYRQQAAAERGADIRAGIGRAYHSPMQHAGQAHVVDIGQLAGQLRRDVHPTHRLADQAVLLRGLSGALPSMFRLKRWPRSNSP